MIIRNGGTNEDPLGLVSRGLLPPSHNGNDVQGASGNHCPRRLYVALATLMVRWRPLE